MAPKHVVVAGVALVGATLGACGGRAEDPGVSARRMAADSIQAVLQRHTDSLMSVPGVVGTAIGQCQGRPCIKVYVARKTPQLLERIPSSLEGFPLAVEETGEIRALDSS